MSISVVQLLQEVSLLYNTLILLVSIVCKGISLSAYAIRTH